jgi:hypothetical protein
MKTQYHHSYQQIQGNQKAIKQLVEDLNTEKILNFKNRRKKEDNNQT